jgi:hypothetical protein
MYLFKVTPFVTLAAFTTALAKVDRLVSKHALEKRFLDDNGNYNVTIVHTNDVHAHLDEWRAGRGTDCTPGSECISGYSRIKTKINELRETLHDPVFLNAGDEFQVCRIVLLSITLAKHCYHRELFSLRIMEAKRFRMRSTKSAMMLSLSGTCVIQLPRSAILQLTCHSILPVLLLLQHEFDKGQGEVMATFYLLTKRMLKYLTLFTSTVGQLLKEPDIPRRLCKLPDE